MARRKVLHPITKTAYEKHVQDGLDRHMSNQRVPPKRN